MVDNESRRCFEESAVNFGAMMLLLVEAGIFTDEKFQEAKIRVRAEIDQQLAERRDEEV